jgi:hypothetical protein
MPFTFRIILSGLMAMVPDRPFQDTLEAADGVTFLFPNLLRPRELEHRMTEAPEFLDPHLPFLEFPTAARLDASTREADLLNPRRSTSLCRLVGEEIEILPIPGLSAGFKMETSIPANRKVAAGDEVKSLFWVTPLEQGSPGRGIIKPGLLDGPLGDKKDIVTRIRFERGRLFTNTVTDRPCRFEPASPLRFERPIALSLALEIEGVPTQVALAMKKQGQDTKVLVLAPKDGQSVVELNLMNREIEDILNPTLPQVLEPDRPLADFEVFYDFSSGFKPGDPRPFLREIPSRGPIQDPPHALCPPTALSRAA